MANPNLANINTYLLETNTANLTSNLTSYLTNLTNSNAILKINSIILHNASNNRIANVTMRLTKASGAVIPLHGRLQIPSNTRSNVITRNNTLVLAEGESFSANSDTGSNPNITITIGYEEISDRLFSTYRAGPGTTNVDYLVIAGGGGGSSGNPGGYEGGGGGGGGCITGTLSNVQLYHRYTITVGGGGGDTARGGNSSIASEFLGCTVSAYGGGAGGGTPGGSGGGATFNGALGLGIFPGSGFISSARQGYSAGTFGGAPCNGGGGGAGAGGGGNTGSPDVAFGQGGVGSSSAFTGTPVTYAGGGGGGATSSANNGGSGGGGRGVRPSPVQGSTAGGTNLGGGGGGGVLTISGASNGGSGVVILRYPTMRAQAFTCGAVISGVLGNQRILCFTGSGAIIFK